MREETLPTEPPIHFGNGRIGWCCRSSSVTVVLLDGFRAEASRTSVLIHQIQVAATIMAGMRWSPNIPRWIVIVLNSLCFVTSFNVSFLLATPECSSNLNPRGRWLSSMAIPLAVVFLCFFWALTTQLWLRCRGKVEAAVKTNRIILQASVYICLIGLYQVWFFSAWSLFLYLYILFPLSSLTVSLSL